MPSKAVPRTYRDGESFELYINHFNRIATANEWEEDATKIAHLETKLTGKALRQFEVFIEQEPKITYEDRGISPACDGWNEIVAKDIRHYFQTFFSNPLFNPSFQSYFQSPFANCIAIFHYPLLKLCVFR